MNGNFWGGVFQGGLAVSHMAQNQQRIDMEQARADREQKAFDDQQEMQQNLRDINNAQSVAMATKKASDDYTSQNPGQTLADGLTKQATDAISADPDASDEEKQARITAATEGIRSGITPKYGIVPDPVNRYRFGLDKATAAENAGDVKTAMMLRKDATDHAVGSFLAAMDSGDDNTAMQLYQVFPNGHQLASFRTNPDGTITTVDADNHSRTNTKNDIANAALQLIGDPTKAAELRMARENAAAIRDAANATRENTTAMMAGARVAASRYGGGAGGGGAGSGGSGSGGGVSGMGRVQADTLGQYGYHKPEDFTNDVFKYVTNNQPSDMSGGDPKKLAQLTYDRAGQLLKAQLGTDKTAQDLIPVAYGMAQREGGPVPGDDPANPIYRPYAQLAADPMTKQIQWTAAVRDARGEVYRLSTQPINPAQFGMRPEAIIQAEANAYRPVLAQAENDPMAMRQVVQRFGAEKAGALMDVYRQSKAGPAPAAPGATTKPIPTSGGQAPKVVSMERAGSTLVGRKQYVATYSDGTKKLVSGDDAERQAILLSN